jgi:hypothetical protein
VRRYNYEVMPIIQCEVEMQGRLYANGLPQVEVYVSTGYKDLVAMPKAGQRVQIILVCLNGSTYQGGLRDYQGRGWPYICPDLLTSSGSKVSLAEFLRANTVPLSSKQPVRFDVSGSTWTLI